MMRLAVLPFRADSAAANMATDFLLLKRYPQGHDARFRAYGWHRPAVTFGYSQKIAWVRAQLVELSGAASVELCRRPTGGGVVDHRADWTYALVIPRGHELEAARAAESYRVVHVALAAALVTCGQRAVVKFACQPPVGDTACAAALGPTVCFERPELYDVIHPETGEKIAGAAQKRSQEGLLFQGSIWRPAASAIADWDKFHHTFVAELARVLELLAAPAPWPEFDAGELVALAETYAARDWTEAR
jgi:lipoyl(octanoyl) transferase